MSGPGATPNLMRSRPRMSGLMVSRLTRSSSNFPKSQRASRSRALRGRGLPARPVGGVEVDDELDLPADVGGEAIERLPGHGVPVLPELGRAVMGPDEQGDRLLEVETVPGVDLEAGERLAGDALALDVVPVARDGHPAALEVPARRLGLADVVIEGREEQGEGARPVQGDGGGEGAGLVHGELGVGPDGMMAERVRLGVEDRVLDAEGQGDRARERAFRGSRPGTAPRGRQRASANRGGS